jgi:two-component system nitrate/nitrite response regulator NarL
LLVDDHPEVLRSLTRLLAPHVDVVAVATEAQQALDAAQRFAPDITVLDITMPGRDGFQIARDLEEQGSRARVIFLTMHESGEFVAQAFRSGGHGYVLKTRLHLDLISALEHVHAGQRFLPSLKSLLALDDEGGLGHVVQFHLDDDALGDSVAGFLNVALRRGHVVSVVLTAPHRAGLARRLQGYGWNVAEAGVSGRYQASDPADALAFAMRDGRPDPDRIEQLISQLEQWRQRLAQTAKTRLFIVGAISEQLVLAGDVTGAIEVETRWAALTRELPWVTVCCYSMESFVDPAQVQVIPDLCAAHLAIAHAQEGAARSLSF